MVRKKKTVSKRTVRPAKKKRKGLSLAEKVVLGLVVFVITATMLTLGLSQLFHWRQTRQLVTIEKFSFFGAGQIEGGFDLALDKRGFLYLMDLDANQILKYDLQGKLLKRFGGKGETAGLFSEPYGLAVDRDGAVFVADTWNGRIQKFSGEGVFLREFPGKFYGPRDVAVDRAGNMYVADSGQHQIEKLRADGKPSAQWGSPQTACSRKRGHFCEPRSLDIDSQGNIYVHDVGNKRIQKLDPQGNVVAAWSVRWAHAKESDYPFVAVGDDGNIYVSCPTENVVACYTPLGELRAFYRLAGEGFKYPTGVAFACGKLYVVNRDIKQVAVCEVPRQ